MRWIYVFLAGNLALVATSLLFMRYGGKNLDVTQGICHILTHGRIWLLGIFIGWISGLLFSLIVTRINLTLAVSLYVPLTYTIAFWGGVFFLKEPVDVCKIVGSVVIILGLCIFFKSKQAL